MHITVRTTLAIRKINVPFRKERVTALYVAAKNKLKAKEERESAMKSK